MADDTSKQISTKSVDYEGRNYRVTFEGAVAAIIEIYVPARTTKGRDGKDHPRNAHWRVLGASMTSPRSALIARAAWERGL